MAGGAPVIPFPFARDTDEAFRLTPEWSTDVLESYDDHEQRIARRGVPLGRIEYVVAQARPEVSTLVAGLLWAHHADQWLVPLWPYAVRLSDDVVAGSSFLPINPPAAGYGLEVVPWAQAATIAHPWVMLWKSDNVYQVFQLDAVAVEFGWGNSWGNSWGANAPAALSGITILGAVQGAGAGWGNAWDLYWDAGPGSSDVFVAGDIVVPMRVARLTPELAASLESLESQSGRVVFQVEESGD